MVDTIITAVSDLLLAFTSDDLGSVFSAVMLLGTSIALFRLLEWGAGGRRD